MLIVGFMISILGRRGRRLSGGVECREGGFGKCFCMGFRARTRCNISIQEMVFGSARDAEMLGTVKVWSLRSATV